MPRFRDHSAARRAFLRRAVRAAAATAAAAALPAPVPAADPAPAVVATTGMIADAARRIAADRIALRGLMGPGVDPHAYRQTRTDVLALGRAELVLWHGLYLEAQMQEFLLELGRRQKVVAVGEAVPRDLLLAHDAYPDRFDPHVWMDPALWSHAVRATGAAIAGILPADAAAEVTAETEAHLGELAALGTYAAEVLGSVPPERRILVTAHDAFRYFGRAWGFEVQGIQGISTESEAGLARIGALVDLLVARRIPAVFVESSVSDRSVRALVEGAAAKGHAVRIGGELFSDAMGEPGTWEGTYPGMIDHNVTVIARALGGRAPARGMAGRLPAGL